MTQATACLNADVQLGNLILNYEDEDGVKWVVSDLEGWWTLPEPEIPDYPMGADDGSYDAAGRYGARVFSVNGLFLPPSPSLVAPSRAKLLRAANLCRQKTWFLTREGDYTRGCEVVMSGQPMVSTVNAQGRTEFSIGLKAPDPIKYALDGGAPPGWYEQTGSGPMTVVNAGDYPVRPVLTVTGAGAGATIANTTTGETMAFREAAALELTIDNRMRSVVAGELRNQRKFLEWDTDWLSLAPGPNYIDVSGATVTVKWRHGWIG